MGTIRRILLTALPKLALSRTTGLLTRCPLPRFLRGPVYGIYARRYGVDLDAVRGEPADYRSLAEFFKRPLRAGARPIDTEAELVWPCDGRIVRAGPLQGERIEQIKGRDYSLAELVRSERLAAAIAGGHQATIYLSPRDYHRVHAPFAGRLQAFEHVPGRLFPVNPGAVRSIFPLFAINERVVFEFELPGGRKAVVVMVAALNVGDIERCVEPQTDVEKGAEIGRFGFGSTTIVLTGPEGPGIPEIAPETAVRVGEAVGR